MSLMHKIESKFEDRFKDITRRQDPSIQFKKIPVVLGKGFPDRYIQIPEVSTLWAEFKYKEVAASTMDRILAGGSSKEFKTELTELQEKFLHNEIWSKGNGGVLMGFKSQTDHRLAIFVCRGPKMVVTEKEIHDHGFHIKWPDQNWPCRDVLNVILGV